MAKSHVVAFVAPMCQVPYVVPRATVRTDPPVIVGSTLPFWLSGMSLVRGAHSSVRRNFASASRLVFLVRDGYAWASASVARASHIPGGRRGPAGQGSQLRSVGEAGSVCQRPLLPAGLLRTW